MSLFGPETIFDVATKVLNKILIHNLLAFVTYLLRAWPNLVEVMIGDIRGTRDTS